MLVTLESLISDSVSNNDLITLENSEFNFDFIETIMECNEIVNDVNTLSCASTIVNEDSSGNIINKKSLLKKAAEKIKEFFQAIGKFFKSIFDKIKSIFTSTKLKVYDEVLKHVNSLPDDFKANIQENDFMWLLNSYKVTGDDVKKFAEDTTKLGEIISSQSNKIMDPDQNDRTVIADEIKLGVETYLESVKSNNLQRAVSVSNPDSFEKDGNPTMVEHDKAWLVEKVKWSTEIGKSYMTVEKSIKKTYDHINKINDDLTKFINENDSFDFVYMGNKVLKLIQQIQTRTSQVMLVLINVNNFTLKILFATGYDGKYKFAEK